MIYSLSGEITAKKEKYIVLKVNNIGYKIFLSKKNLGFLRLGEKKDIFCYLDVKERGLDLYGFLNSEELEFFEILEQIRGVGPKAALEIASLGPLKKIKERILANDEKLFEGISGIGRKKAMAIILELSGKIKDISQGKNKKEENNEALNALVNLGFSKQEAQKALKKISGKIKETEEKIKQALKILAEK